MVVHLAERRTRLRHVRQRDRWDCGVAVAATLSGFSYELTLDTFRNHFGDIDGVRSYQLREILERLTGKHWRRLDGVGLLPVRRACVQRPGRIALLYEHERGRHWIAAHDGVVFDPSQDRPLPIA